MLCLTACSFISGVSGTVRQCDPEGNYIIGCKTKSFELDTGGDRRIISYSGQNSFCPCSDDLCNKSPWLEWTKPTTRRPTTRRSTTLRQAVVTRLISEDDSRSTTGSLHITDQNDIDSEGVPLMEKSMSTQSMDHTLLASYNDHSTDKIQSNGVKALNDDIVFVTLLTLLIIIFR